MVKKCIFEYYTFDFLIKKLLLNGIPKPIQFKSLYFKII